MAYATAGDGVRLYYEEAGGGTPIVFVHEFGGSYWSWEPQMGFFSRRHRCVTFAARGYAPSDIPESVDAYSQAQAADDIVHVMDAAGIDKAHIVGLSMGGFACLHAAIRHPGRVLSVVAAGTGYGAELEHDAYFKGVSEQVAQNFETRGASAFAPIYAEGASRVQFQNKDPRGWALFAERLGLHSSAARPTPCAACRRADPRSMRWRRSSGARGAGSGDGRRRGRPLPPARHLPEEDDSAAGLCVLPKAGHTLNLEEPDLFNRFLAEFLAQVEAGQWAPRDPRANPAQIMRTD